MNIKIEPIYEQGRSYWARRIQGWSMNANGDNNSFGFRSEATFDFRSEAIDAAAQLARFAEGPVTIEIVR